MIGYRLGRVHFISSFPLG